MEDLKGTAYVILGMIGLGPDAPTGYDIKNAVDRSARFFWNASYGQIYPELRQLESAGLVKGRSAPSGGRQRREYELTAKGQEELLNWLAQPADMPQLRDESLLKLFFSDSLPREQALATLRRRREGHQEFLDFLLEVQARPGGKDPDFVDLVLRYGIAYAEFNIDWCTREERRLGRKEAA
jgi:PadR family transcriptional regulator, regulatory protein AphA